MDTSLPENAFGYDEGVAVAEPVAKLQRYTDKELAEKRNARRQPAKRRKFDVVIMGAPARSPLSRGDHDIIEAVDGSEAVSLFLSRYKVRPEDVSRHTWKTYAIDDDRPIAPYDTPEKQRQVDEYRKANGKSPVFSTSRRK